MAEYPITSTAPGAGLSKERPRRSRSSRAARWLAIAMILAGGLALLDGAVTLLWQEPISALIAKLRQDRLSGQLRQVEEARPTAVEQHALAGLADERQRIAFLAEALQRGTHDGSAVGRIVIPRIGASFVMVDGTNTADLESGPGIYSETTFPGIAGTTAIAGHRTTYLAPFRHIDALAPGNTIRLYMPYAPLHLHRHRASGRRRRPTCGRPSPTSATAAWCCRPARRCSAPPNGCWSTPG